MYAPIRIEILIYVNIFVQELRNADPVWLHEQGLWEYMTPDNES